MAPDNFDTHKKACSWNLTICPEAARGGHVDYVQSGGTPLLVHLMSRFHQRAFTCS